MSRLRKYLQEHPVSGWILTLEYCVRILNSGLAACGAAILAYAIYVYVIFREHTQSGTTQVPWPVYAYGIVGLVTVGTAITALVGVSTRTTSCLNSNLVLMSILLAFQACLAVSTFMSSDTTFLPDETTQSVIHFIKQRLAVFKWVGLAVAIVEGLTLTSGCLLQSAYTSIEDAAEDLEDQPGPREPLLRSPLTSPPPRTARNDPWSQRMHQQYGLDTSVFSYNPERGQQDAAPHIPTRGQQPKDRGCVVM